MSLLGVYLTRSAESWRTEEYGLSVSFCTPTHLTPDRCGKWSEAKPNHKRQEKGKLSEVQN